MKSFHTDQLQIQAVAPQSIPLFGDWEFRVLRPALCEGVANKGPDTKHKVCILQTPDAQVGTS